MDKQKQEVLVSVILILGNRKGEFSATEILLYKQQPMKMMCVRVFSVNQVITLCCFLVL